MNLLTYRVYLLVNFGGIKCQTAFFTVMIVQNREQNRIRIESTIACFLQITRN